MVGYKCGILVHLFRSGYILSVYIIIFFTEFSLTHFPLNECKNRNRYVCTIYYYYYYQTTYYSKLQIKIVIIWYSEVIFQSEM